MSHPSLHDADDDGPALKPRPRRPFELSSPPPSAPSTPPTEHPPSLQPPPAASQTIDGATTPSRTRSILNLTSSTLLGIYGYTPDRDDPTSTTPWGTGAETPAASRRPSLDALRAGLIPDTELQRTANGTTHARRRSTAAALHKAALDQHSPPRHGLRAYLPLLSRALTLSIVGALSGLLTAHLHDRRDLAPVRIPAIDRGTPAYLLAWALAGICLGEALPLFDKFWDTPSPTTSTSSPSSSAVDDTLTPARSPRQDEHDSARRGLGGWNDAVRAVGAFVGLAFAVRKLPWQSSLQLSATLALANPAVWYLVDRSGPGLVLASGVAVGGTGVLLGVVPGLVPGAVSEDGGGVEGVMGRNGTTGGAAGVEGWEGELVWGLLSVESVGVATWLASVFFVSTVCFGNIGRRLAIKRR